MSEITREMTHEEEYEILRKECDELFEREADGCEPPFANCVVRRALRCIRKLRAEIQWLKSKQTARKITHEATLRSSCTCPSCKNVVDKFEQFGDSRIRVTYDYCHFCGQKLDWSDITNER